MEKMEIKVSANQKERTFTIRQYLRGKIFSKYRTFKMSKIEFLSESNNTVLDWKNFLLSNDYYLVK